MIDYSVCTLQTLKEHICEQMCSGWFSLFHDGLYYGEANTEEQFRDELDTFVSACNQERVTAEGYELCEDVDPVTGIVTFYVMREDGVTVVELSVLFLEKVMGAELYDHPL